MNNRPQSLLNLVHHCAPFSKGQRQFRFLHSAMYHNDVLFFPFYNFHEPFYSSYRYKPLFCQLFGWSFIVLREQEYIYVFDIGLQVWTYRVRSTQVCTLSYWLLQLFSAVFFLRCPFPDNNLKLSTVNKDAENYFEMQHKMWTHDAVELMEFEIVPRKNYVEAKIMDGRKKNFFFPCFKLEVFQCAF